jgi:hypothetical protein
LSYWVDDESADSTSYFKDKTIVFFAMPNEWKTSQRNNPRAGGIIWDADSTFTNSGGYCSPKFVWDSPLCKILTILMSGGTLLIDQ